MLSRVLAVALVLGLVLGATGTGAPAAEPTVAAGSGSSVAAARALAAACMQRHPGMEIQVAPSIGSAGAVRAVADGAIAIGLVSRTLQGGERDLGLTVIPYARTAVVLGAHPAVQDSDISMRDLVDVYAGRKTRWSDGHEIVVLTREPGDASIQVIQTLVPGFRQAYEDSQRARRWRTVFTHREMSQALMRTPYALGITDIGALKAAQVPIRALRVNGVAPTAAEVHGQRYPLVKTLYFAIDPRRTTRDVQRFIDFALSAEGAKVLAGEGYLSPSTR